MHISKTQPPENPPFVRNDKIPLKPPPSGKQQPENQASPTTQHRIPPPTIPPRPLVELCPPTSILDTHPSRDDGMPPEPHRPHRLMGNLHSTYTPNLGSAVDHDVSTSFFPLDSDETFTITVAATPTTADHWALRLTQYSVAPIWSSRRCRCHVSPPPRTQHVGLEPHVLLLHRDPGPVLSRPIVACHAAGVCLAAVSIPRPSGTWTLSLPTLGSLARLFYFRRLPTMKCLNRFPALLVS